MNTRLLAVLCVAGLGLSAGAQTWIGAAGSDWLSAANWSPGVVPGFGANQNAVAQLNLASGLAALTDAPDIMYLDSLRVPGRGMTVRLTDADAEINSGLDLSGRLLIEHGAFRSRVRFHGINLNGGGEIVLDDGGVRSRAVLAFTNNPSIATGTNIHGRGSVSGVCINSGMITADQPGSTLYLDPAITDTVPYRNRGRISAVNGASLEIGTFEFDNTGGVIHADTGAVHFRQGLDLTGGTLSTAHGGQVYIHDSIFSSGTAFAGEIFVADAALLRFNFDNLHPTVTNTGTIHALNLSGGPNAATLNLRSSTTFTGGGAISLDGRTGLWTEAQITSAAYVGVLTNGNGHTLRGLGVVDLDLVNHGLVRVGYPGDVPNNDQITVMEFTRAPSLAGGTLEIPIAGDGAHGTMFNRAALTLAGSLRVVLEDGPLPGPGVHWDLILAPTITGSFSSVELPAVPAGRRWRAETVHGEGVESFRVSLECTADFNGDGFVDFFDYDGFVAAFERGDSSADVNGDGFLDFFDYDDFIAAFEAGC